MSTDLMTALHAFSLFPSASMALESPYLRHDAVATLIEHLTRLLLALMNTVGLTECVPSAAYLPMLPIGMLFV